MRISKRVDSRPQTPLTSPKKVTLNLKLFSSPHAITLGSSNKIPSSSQLALFQSYETQVQEQNSFCGSINSFDDCSFVALKQKQSTESEFASSTGFQSSQKEQNKLHQPSYRQNGLNKCGSSTALRPSSSKKIWTSCRNIQTEMTPQESEYKASSVAARLIRSRKTRGVAVSQAYSSIPSSPFQNDVIANLISSSQQCNGENNNNNNNNNFKSPSKPSINPAYRLDSKFCNNLQFNNQATASYFFSCNDLNVNNGVSVVPQKQECSHHRGASLKIKKARASPSQVMIPSVQNIQEDKDGDDDILKIYEINWKNGECGSLKSVTEFQDESKTREKSFSPQKQKRNVVCGTFGGEKKGEIGSEYSDQNYNNIRSASSQKNILLKQFKIVKNQEHRIIKKFEKEQAKGAVQPVGNSESFFCSLKDIMLNEASKSSQNLQFEQSVQIFNSKVSLQDEEDQIKIRPIKPIDLGNSDTSKLFLVRKMQTQNIKKRIHGIGENYLIKRPEKCIKQVCNLIQSAQIL